jgi:hypothetical protein
MLPYRITSVSTLRPENQPTLPSFSTVEADEQIELEGWTQCPAFTTRTSQVYKSAPFLALAAEQKEYLDSLVPLLDGRTVTLENMYNVFDYMNVQNIHNATFREIVSANGTSDYIMVSGRNQLPRTISDINPSPLTIAA